MLANFVKAGITAVILAAIATAPLFAPAELGVLATGEEIAVSEAAGVGEGASLEEVGEGIGESVGEIGAGGEGGGASLQGLSPQGRLVSPQKRLVNPQKRLVSPQGRLVKPQTTMATGAQAPQEAARMKALGPQKMVRNAYLASKCRGIRNPPIPGMATLKQEAGIGSRRVRPVS